VRSLLAQERGLKRYSMVYLKMAMQVAPRAGAWIETSPHRFKECEMKVAPRAGAWIETGMTLQRN